MEVQEIQGTLLIDSATWLIDSPNIAFLAIPGIWPLNIYTLNRILIFFGIKPNPNLFGTNLIPAPLNQIPICDLNQT